ncbi:MAG: bacterial transcriptional activator domain-containing protein, partial [Actinomycetia bacterium]|nr:bacterial transcriptional activator domain-containing protein [Actinomycetes bacterium]
LLRMIPTDVAQAALAESAGVLTDAEIQRLAERIVGKKRAHELLAPLAEPLPLKVQVLGGLRVQAPWGLIPDKAWGKRKSRVLFAMMAVSRGKDISRDVLFEHMWMGLPPGRALANFYVVWSHMRKALMPNPHAGCPYVEHRGGVCRIMPGLVETDLDEFYEVAGTLRAAVAEEDVEAAIKAGERLLAIYQGELLPGDLYDDWFTPIRNDLRHEFGDLMALVGDHLAVHQQPAAGMRFLRAALAQDPWREDLYQIALRCQIAAGQRSGAVETYLACRARLSEDLGLDPSAETQRLYEQILAMETPPPPADD